VSNSIKIKLTNSRGSIKLANANFAYVAAPGSRPTIITSTIANFNNYSNTELMLANDATTYANAVNYVEGKSYVNTSQLAANLANFTPATNLQVSSLTDVVATSPSNNATLVYSSANNKYIVKQLDLDGGNF
jgi:hypothetical protein